MSHLAAVLMTAALGFMSGACAEKTEVRSRLEDGVVHPLVYTCKRPSATVRDLSPELACTLTIKTQPAIEISTPTCDELDLAEEAMGKAVAYRCHASALDPSLPWNVIRLRGGDRYLEECNLPNGSDRKPDWSKVGPIEPSAMRLLDCAKGAPKPWAEIARSIAEESGQELAAKFVVATTLRPADSMGNALQNYRDGWVDAFDGLPESARAIVRSETCPSLLNPTTPSILYVRAARRCPLDIPKVADVALAAFKNGLAAPRWDFVGSSSRHEPSVAPTELNSAELALMMEGWIALKQRPKEAAEGACQRIAKLQREQDPIRVSLAATILALTKTRCAAVDTYSQLWPCGLDSPFKTLIAENVARFGATRQGTPPVLASANHAMFEALTIDGKYPPEYIERQTDGGFTGGFCF